MPARTVSRARAMQGPEPPIASRRQPQPAALQPPSRAENRHTPKEQEPRFPSPPERKRRKGVAGVPVQDCISPARIACHNTFIVLRCRYAIAPCYIRGRYQLLLLLDTSQQRSESHKPCVCTPLLHRRVQHARLALRARAKAATPVSGACMGTSFSVLFLASTAFSQLS